MISVDFNEDERVEIASHAAFSAYYGGTGGTTFQIEFAFGFDFQGGPPFAVFSKGWEASRVETIEL